jgi:MYXO-CTERM domain-containing protein
VPPLSVVSNFGAWTPWRFTYYGGMLRLLSFVFVVCLLLVSTSADAAPVTNPTLAPSGSTTVTFNEVAVANNTNVTTQFQPLGVVFGASPVWAKNVWTYPGISNDSIDNFSGSQFCQVAPYIITFPTEVDWAGFNIVTNADDDVQLTALKGGNIVETNLFSTDLSAPHFIGFDIPAGFDELQVDVMGTSNGCMIIDNLILSTDEVSVLVIGDGDATATVQAALTAAGHAVTIAPVIESSYNGTNPSPAGFCSVVHLNGDTFASGMPVAGQQALESYVQAGGGFVGMEWNAYEEGSLLSMVNMPNLILGQRVNGAEGLMTYNLTTAGQTHPVTAGLPSSFSFSAGHNIGTCKPGSTVLALEGSNDAVCVRPYGAGRVVYFNHAGHYSVFTPFTDPNVQQLLVQAVEWSCTEPAVCGDGVAEGGEACDDGGESATCDSDCTAATCGDGTTNVTAGEICDDMGESVSCNVDCTAAICGDGTTNVTAGEDCDDVGESATCDVDCTLAICGDGTTNVTASENCDDMGESAACDADCTLAICGDGTTNMTAGEICDDMGESAACDTDCTLVSCGDGTTNATAGEQCDDSGESITCDVDCSTASCGDGTLNTTAGEICDDAGESLTCDDDCTAPSCGDGNLNVTAGEICDDGMETASCNSNCTSAGCGDGVVNATAGEDCDGMGETATCDDDCTDAVCGDGTVNASAGEECDDDDTTGGDGCAADCTEEGMGGSGGGGATSGNGGATSGNGGAGTGGAAVGAGPGGGDNDNGDVPPEEGCSCRTVGGPQPQGAPALLLITLCLAAARRRRNP